MLKSLVMANTTVRRVVMTAAFVLMFVIALVTAIPGYLIAFVVDRVTRRTALVPTLIWMHIYIFFELLGIAVWVWLGFRKARMSPERWLDLHYEIERRWLRLQFFAGLKLYGIRLETHGSEVLAKGPYILLSRHVSVLDNMIPSVFAESGHGIRLRWVFSNRLKRQPSVDIYGHRVPNVFIDRKPRKAIHEVMRIAELAKNLGPRDAVSLYPEGTLYSPSKQKNALQRFMSRRRSGALMAGEDFANVLPPEPGGVTMLLRAAPEVDVVFCAHSGLEEGRHRALIANGGLRGRTLRIHFWRVPASEIPKSSPGRRAWLIENWREVDRIVGEGLAADANAALKQTAG